MQALSAAVSRLQVEKNVLLSEDLTVQADFEASSGMCVEDVVITMDDLRVACRLQARGHLKRVKLERRIKPICGLKSLVTSETAMAQLKDVVMVEKVRSLLSTRWGFQSRMGRSNCILVFAPQGCGKTFAAGCVGYETGRTLQTVSMSELTTGGPVSDFFSESSIAGAVVVIEQAEQLLLEVANTTNASSPALEVLCNVQEYNGLVILCCATVSTPSNAGWDVFQPVPSRLSSLLSSVIHLERPNAEARLRLWQQLMPKEMPLDENVGPKLKEIADLHEFTGARINTCIRRAAAAAALRSNSAALRNVKRDTAASDLRIADVKVTLQDIRDSCDAEHKMEAAAGGSQYWGNLYV
eukprot:Plantae.Rhodophyta-Palmaria_palmata.ctg4126.p1 GENE.Plantae.Rhodophyta-Palmaria_palmata.ctg4126~~Plantae.Rhodophyta-Palmaria_palmata.ctg4126.p1  ORF type:complete len:369 (+),score=58.65 Plantae.Rhodophyta-Palmaria_palmata.ctg4126:48-1109(+)